MNSTSMLQHLTFAHVSTLFDTNLMRHVFIRNPLQKLPPMAAALAPYCGRLRMVADADSSSRTRLYPRLPKLNENSSLCIGEKHSVELVYLHGCSVPATYKAHRPLSVGLESFWKTQTSLRRARFHQKNRTCKAPALQWGYKV